jgi:hypothetical protein
VNLKILRKDKGCSFYYAFWRAYSLERRFSLFTPTSDERLLVLPQRHKNTKKEEAAVNLPAGNREKKMSYRLPGKRIC